ncbi:MAG: hypothetical protein ABII07_04400 [Patescibacteria group bacterium]|nr:hypothetical protein [Patescibacteria group bacterium]
MGVEESSEDLFGEEIELSGDSQDEFSWGSLNLQLFDSGVEVKCGDAVFLIKPDDDLEGWLKKLQLASRLEYSCRVFLKAVDLIDDVLWEKELGFDDASAHFVMRCDPKIGGGPVVKNVTLSCYRYSQMTFLPSSMDFWDDLEMFIEIVQESLGLTRMVVFDCKDDSIMADEEVSGEMSVLAALPEFKPGGMVLIRFYGDPVAGGCYHREDFCEEGIPEFLRLRHEIGEEIDSVTGFSGRIFRGEGEEPLTFSASTPLEVVEFVRRIRGE